MKSKIGVLTKILFVVMILSILAALEGYSAKIEKSAECDVMFDKIVNRPTHPEYNLNDLSGVSDWIVNWQEDDRALVEWHHCLGDKETLSFQFINYSVFAIVFVFLTVLSRKIDALKSKK